MISSSVKKQKRYPKSHPACQNSFKPDLMSDFTEGCFPHRFKTFRKTSDWLNLHSSLEETFIGMWIQANKEYEYSLFTSNGKYASAFLDAKFLMERFDEVLNTFLPLSSPHDTKFDYEPMVILNYQTRDFIIYLRSLNEKTSDKFIRRVDNFYKIYSYEELLKHYSL